MSSRSRVNPRSSRPPCATRPPFSLSYAGEEIADCDEARADNLFQCQLELLLNMFLFCELLWLSSVFKRTRDLLGIFRAAQGLED